MDDAPGGWQVMRNRETPNQSVWDPKMKRREIRSSVFGCLIATTDPNLDRSGSANEQKKYCANSLSL